MTETPPIITLNDLPTELIERFAPDRRPTTISFLKLVSKRFYNIFSYDYFYKFYLHFPEKHYLCEAKCKKNSGKEVFKDIESGSVGKWKGYLTIENIHLKNLSEGKITHSEIMPFPKPPDFAGFHYLNMWQELIDEDSEHWLLNVSNDGAIVLLNITDKPKILVYPELDTAAHEIVKLVSGQVICLNFSRIKMLDIVYDGDVISLQYNFAFDIYLGSTSSWDILSGKCESDGSYKNLLIYGLSGNSGILHFRDLNTGNLLEDICLRDYKFLDSYANDANAYFEFPPDVEPAKKLKFPYILVRLGGIGNCKILILFNLEKMQVSTFFDIFDNCVTSCYITSNVAYIFSSNSDAVDFDLVNVYCVSLEHSCKKMEKPTAPYRLCQIRATRYSSIVVSKHLKFAFKDNEVSNKVHIMSIKDMEVSDLQVFLDIDKPFVIVGMIGPDILIIETYRPGNIIFFKIPKEEGGLCEKVIDWGRVVVGTNHDLSVRCCQNMLDLVNYSKLIFKYQNLNYEEYLAIINF